MDESKRPVRFGKILVGVLLGLGSPLLLFLTLGRDFVQRHWLLSLAATIIFELLIVAVGLFAKVYSTLEGRWVERMANWIDGVLLRRTSQYGRKYRQYITSLHHDLDLRGLTTVGEYALPIGTVFVDLSLEPAPLHEAENDPLQLQTRRASEVKAQLVAARRRRSIWELLTQTEDDAPARLAIIGPPGSGKTTLLRHVASTLANGATVLPRGHPAKSLLPFLVFLREHVSTMVNEPESRLTDILRKEMKKIGAQEPPGWLEEQLDKGRCLILLDGLDEVATNEDRKTVVAWVDTQIATYSKNIFAVTSRPYGYRSQPLLSATVLQVRPFTEAQVSQFLHNWYLAIHSRATGRLDIGVRQRADEDAGHLLERLGENSSLYDLAVNPLLLTMIAHVHFYRGALPGSRVELYREVCQVFLGKRQEAKHLTSKLTTDQKEAILRVLAVRMMENRTRDVTIAQAQDFIGPTLRRVGAAADLSSSEFMEYVETTSGLLVEREFQLYSFTHLTLQEYLAAAYVKEQREVEALSSRIDDEWWREVQLLYAAQSDATPLIRACLEGPEPSVYALALAVDCLEIAREVDPAARQALDAALDAEAVLEDTERSLRIRTVRLNRRLRMVVRLGEDTQVCRDLVSRDDLQLLVDRMNPQYAYPAENHVRRQLLAQYGSQEAALGVGYEDALTFASWAQDAYSAAQQGPVGAGWIYRLPSLQDHIFESEFVRSLVGERGVWTIEGVLELPSHHQETPTQVEIILGRVLCDFLSYRLVVQEPSRGGGFHGQTREIEVRDSHGESISIDGLPILECLKQCQAFISSNRDNLAGMLAEDQWIVEIAETMDSDEYALSVRKLLSALYDSTSAGLYVPTQYLLELIHQSVAVLTAVRDSPGSSRELEAISEQVKVAAEKARLAIIEYLGRGSRAAALFHVACAITVSVILRLDRLGKSSGVGGSPLLQSSARELDQPDVRTLEPADAIAIAYRNLMAALPPLMVRYSRSRDILPAREVALLVRDRGLSSQPGRSAR